MSKRGLDEEREYLKGQVAALAYMCGVLAQLPGGRETLSRTDFKETALADAAIEQGRASRLAGFERAVDEITLRIELLD